MTPEQVAQRLTELHDASLKDIYESIKEHKEALHGLIQQAQEELATFVTPVQKAGDAGAAEQPAHEEVAARGKRRPASASAAAAAADRPVKRGRGRPPKQCQPEPVIEEEEEEGAAGDAKEQQAAASTGSEQPSVSLTLHVSTLETCCMDTGDDVTSVPAAGARTRTTRRTAGRGTTAAPATAAAIGGSLEAATAPAATARSKRAAAAAATSSSRSTRNTRMRAAPAAEPVLEAIEEETAEAQVQDVQQQQAAEAGAPVDEPGQEQQGPDDDQVAAAEAPPVMGADPEQPGSEPAPDAQGALQVEQQLAAAEDAEAEAACAGNVPAAADGVSDMAVDRNDAVQQDTDNMCEEQQDLSLHNSGGAAVAAAVAAVPPKTPRFSLRPSDQQQPESDTPRFVGQPPSTAGRHSTRRQRASSVCKPTAAAGAAAAGEEAAGDAAAEAAGTSLPSIQKVVPGSVRRSQRQSGTKNQSLSFGRPLQGPLYQETEPAPAAAADGTTTGPITADKEPAAEIAAAPAAGSVDWKAFVSSMHATDAPTPAASRSRNRSSVSAAAVSGGQKQDQLRSSCRTGQPPAAAEPLQEEAAPAAVAGKGQSSATRHLSRASMLCKSSPRLQSVPEADDASAAAAVAADNEEQQQAGSGCQQQHKARPSRSRTPNSARRSKVGLAAALEAAAAEKDKLEQLQVAALAAVAAAGSDKEAPEDDEQFVDGRVWMMEEERAALQAAGTEVDGMAAEDEHIEEAVEMGLAPGEAGQAAEQAEAEDVGMEAAAAEGADAAEDEAEEAQQQAADAAVPDGAEATADAEQSMGTSQQAEVEQQQQQQQLETAKAQAAADAAGGASRPNLVSSIRSFVPAVAKKETTAPVAAGKVKVKVKALEAAMVAKHAEEARAQERAARQREHKEQQQQAKARVAAAGEARQQLASLKSKVAAVERAATGLTGSGGAVRVVVAGKQPGESQEEPARPADKEAAQKKAEKEAEAAKRAMDKAEREERMRRAEQKRKEDENKRRAELAEKQRLKLERAAAAAALKAHKPAAGGGGAAASSGAAGAANSKAAAVAAAARAAGGQAADAKAGSKHQQHAAAAADGFKTPAPPKAVPRQAGGDGGAAAAAAAGAGAAASGEGDSPSLTIKVLEPVSTGSKKCTDQSAAAAAAGTHSHQQHHGAAGVMGPPAPVALGTKTPAAYKTPAPTTVSEQEKRNVEALKSSPYVNTGSKRTPHTAQQPSYVISPFRDDDEDTPDRSHKPIPNWARSQPLFEALKAQQHKDPDTIFGARQTTCDLADMFVDVPPSGATQQHRHKVRKLGQRSSSADWSQDRLTWQEEINYKKELGYL